MHQKNKMHPSVDEYVKFVEKDNENLYAVEVIKGAYTGVVYTYGQVQLHEDEANDQLNLKFDFKINEVPENFTIKELENLEDFKHFMGDILSLLLEDKFNNDELTNINT